MSTDVFLTVDPATGLKKQVQALATSAGAGDANKITRTGADGKLHSSLMANGVEIQTKIYPSNGNIANGDFINIYDDSGTPTARKADATNNRKAIGYVLEGNGNAPPANVTVYMSGTNSAVTIAATESGKNVFLAAAGGFSASVPTPGATVILQRLGIVSKANEIVFESDPEILYTV